MQRGLFAVHLFAGSRDEQLAAIRALAGTTDPQVKSLIDEFRPDGVCIDTEKAPLVTFLTRHHFCRFGTFTTWLAVTLPAKTSAA